MVLFFTWQHSGLPSTLITMGTLDSVLGIGDPIFCQIQDSLRYRNDRIVDYCNQYRCKYLQKAGCICKTAISELPIVINRILHDAKTILYLTVNNHLQKYASNQSTYGHCDCRDIFEMILFKNIHENGTTEDNLENPYGY